MFVFQLCEPIAERDESSKNLGFGGEKIHEE